MPVGGASTGHSSVLDWSNRLRADDSLQRTSGYESTLAAESVASPSDRCDSGEPSDHDNSGDPPDRSGIGEPSKKATGAQADTAHAPAHQGIARIRRRQAGQRWIRTD